MQDKLCRPDDYGPCRYCNGQVTLVIMDNGQRKSQESADTVVVENWICEKCMQKRYSHGTWKPDELTKVVLAGADPILANAFLEIQSLITTVFRGTHARQTV